MTDFINRTSRDILDENFMLNGISQNKTHFKTIIPNKINNNSNESTSNIAFKGITTPDSRSMFVFDLDGTFAHGNNSEINQVLKLQQKANAHLIYATGNTLKEFYRLQSKLALKNINLPTPEYLISNNGQYIYQNIEGNLTLIPEWKNQIITTTGFNKEKVLETLQNLANQPEYQLDKTVIQQLQLMNNYKSRVQEDSEYINSKISYYEWNPSEFMIEFFVSADTNIEKLKNDIRSKLAEHNITTKFIQTNFSKKIMDGCTEELLLKVRPHREAKDGSMNVLFICPAHKSDAVEFLRNRLGIDYSEIVMAGNDTNDISMSNLCKKGAHFICVSNAAAELIKHVNYVKSTLDDLLRPNLLTVKNEGTKGVLDGLNKIFSELKWI